MFYVFLAEGFEEIEALTPVDILRRAGIEVKTVGVTGKSVRGSHGILVSADLEFADWNDANPEALILPGGMPGTRNLGASQKLCELLVSQKNTALICAICAAPSVLGKLGLLNGKKATCFPGFEQELLGAQVQPVGVVTDGNIITGKGAGVAAEFAFAIVEKVKGKQEAEALRNTMCYQ
jgi:4-methyl-5(b-hydroxyethyl)-thiazole monophosphate biosynthesis